MSSAAAALDAQAAPSTDDPQAAPGLDGVRLSGARLRAAVEEAAQNAETDDTMEGASTFTLTLIDPEDELLRSSMFDAAVDVTVDGDVYRLVRIASRPPLLTLTFEDRDVWRMRQRKKPRKAKRSSMTRAEFIASMAREERPRVPVFAPEAPITQPLAGEEKDKAKAKKKRQPGFARGAKITVKGKRASAAQRRVLDDVLEEGTRQKASERVLIGAVMCVTGESLAQNLAGGDRDSVGAFQQRRSQGWPATRNVRKDAREFFKRAIPAFRRHGTAKSIGWIVDSVQRSFTYGTARQGAEYDRWREEAERTVKAWGGGSPGADGRRRKGVVFRRGEPGKPESSWDAAGRLAGEVRWRRFMRRGTLWVVRDEWLIKRRARMVLTRRSRGVQRIEFEWDSGKRVQGATVTMLAAYNVALPGDRIDLRDVGKAGSGPYLLSSARRSRFSPLVTVELRRPVAALPEPRGEQVQPKSTGGGGSRSTGRGGDGDATGNWQWPTEVHYVTSPFGQRWGRLHDGIDIGAAHGAAVRAVDGGRVTRAGWNGGYGNYVEIDHGGGLVSFYAHLSAVSTRSGARVGKGELLGRVGNTGASRGAHLHFGVHKGGQARNPREWLK